METLRPVVETILSSCDDVALKPCRFVVATTTSKEVLLWTLLGPVTIAGSLGTPVQTIAIKRFTTESNRWASFG